MEKIIKGKKYNFHIVRNSTKFFIKAIDRMSGKYSFINNLNVILSELGVPQNDSQYYDSKWETEKSNNFCKKIVNFLSDAFSLNYIENKLDEDRYCGEWEDQ